MNSLSLTDQRLSLAKHSCYTVYIHSHTYYVTVPTSQSEVAVMQSHDYQPRQDDEKSPVEISNGMCICIQVQVKFIYACTIKLTAVVH